MELLHVPDQGILKFTFVVLFSEFKEVEGVVVLDCQNLLILKFFSRKLVIVGLPFAFR